MCFLLNYKKFSWIHTSPFQNHIVHVFTRLVCAYSFTPKRWTHLHETIYDAIIKANFYKKKSQGVIFHGSTQYHHHYISLSDENEGRDFLTATGTQWYLSSSIISLFDYKDKFNKWISANLISSHWDERQLLFSAKINTNSDDWTWSEWFWSL